MKDLTEKNVLKELKEVMESLTKQKKAMELVDYSAFEDDRARREAERDNDMRFISTKLAHPHQPLPPVLHPNATPFFPSPGTCGRRLYRGISVNR